MLTEATYDRRGYLHEDFHLFHLKDQAGQEADFHYHDFCKVVFFLSGKVTYTVEGVSYRLHPGDVLLIDRYLVHRAMIDMSVPYERIILYLSAGFVEANSGEGEQLTECFERANEKGIYLLRAEDGRRAELLHLLEQLEKTVESENFGAKLWAKTIFLQIMIQLNRIMLADGNRAEEAVFVRDPRILEILTYIDNHLSDPMTVEELSMRCFISKYHFMRRFKEVTGYTVHGYIRKKRILLASRLLREGVSAAEAAEKCGFCDYSAFQRAFKSELGVTPGRYC